MRIGSPWPETNWWQSLRLHMWEFHQRRLRLLRLYILVLSAKTDHAYLGIFPHHEEGDVMAAHRI